MTEWICVALPDIVMACNGRNVVAGYQVDCGIKYVTLQYTLQHTHNWYLVVSLVLQAYSELHG